MKKVKFLRTVDSPAGYFKKDTVTEIPDDLAKQWSTGKKPAVEILSAK